MRYNPPCVCGRSSSGRARPCQGRGSEFEPRRPLQKETPSVRMVFSFWNVAGRLELAASTCAQRVKFRGEAGFLRMAMPFAGCREASSSLVARSKKERHPHGCLSFLERRFCCAKSVACGRVIEREWGNPQRFPPHTPPSLRWAGVRATKPVGNHKNKTPSEGMGFCFWNAAGRFELTASTCAKRVKFRGEAGFLRMAMPFAGCREASSSLVTLFAFALSFRASDRCHWRGNP